MCGGFLLISCNKFTSKFVPPLLVPKDLNMVRAAF